MRCASNVYSLYLKVKYFFLTWRSFGKDKCLASKNDNYLRKKSDPHWIMLSIMIHIVHADHTIWHHNIRKYNDNHKCYINTQHCWTCDETAKELVVFLSNTVVNPRAVMVKSTHANITECCGRKKNKAYKKIGKGSLHFMSTITNI